MFIDAYGNLASPSKCTYNTRAHFASHMLNILRKNTKAIIWTVILGFAIWGAGSIAMGRQGKNAAAGVIFGEKILVSEFNQASRAMQILTAVGQDPSLGPDQIDTETWKHLILIREAKIRSIGVSDEEVTQKIRTLFGGKEGFDKDRYAMWVKTVYGNKPRDFEEEMRGFLLIEKLIDSLKPKIEPAEDEIWDWYKKTFLGFKEGEALEGEEEKHKNFQENLDSWKKTYTSFKESEAVGKSIEEIEKRADLKNFIPPRPSASPPVNAPPDTESLPGEATNVAESPSEPTKSAPLAAPQSPAKDGEEMTVQTADQKTPDAAAVTQPEKPAG